MAGCVTARCSGADLDPAGDRDPVLRRCDFAHRPAVGAAADRVILDRGSLLAGLLDAHLHSSAVDDPHLHVADIVVVEVEPFFPDEQGERRFPRRGRVGVVQAVAQGCDHVTRISDQITSLIDVSAIDERLMQAIGGAVVQSGLVRSGHYSSSLFTADMLTHILRTVLCRQPRLSAKNRPHEQTVTNTITHVNYRIILSQK